MNVWLKQKTICKWSFICHYCLFYSNIKLRCLRPCSEDLSLVLLITLSWSHVYETMGGNKRQFGLVNKKNYWNLDK